MNRSDNQIKSLKWFEEQTKPDQTILTVQRPLGGWLHTVRQALGFSLKNVADRLQLSPQAIHQVEKSEASGAISLRQLETVAGAMGCRVVYVLVPRVGAEGWAQEQHSAAQRLRARARGPVAPGEAEGGELPMALR